MSDHAKKLVAALLADLQDRRGLRHEWERIDDDMQKEIVAEWERIADKHIQSLLAEVLP